MPVQLTQNDIEDLKQQGFSDAEISKAVRELEQAYLPDFTARSLGLGAEELTLKQARKRIGKLQTGIEVRRGIKLLKGIPD